MSHLLFLTYVYNTACRSIMRRKEEQEQETKMKGRKEMKKKKEKGWGNSSDVP